MLNLNGTTDQLQLVTSAASLIDVVAEYVDTNTPMTTSSNVTPSNQVTSIFTATTQTIVSGAASNIVRNVKFLSIRNKDAALANTVTVQHYNGSTAYQLMSVTLQIGEELALREGTWFHYDANAGVISTASYVDSSVPLQLFAPSTFIAETMDRATCPEVNTAYATTGVLYLQAIWLRKGQRINNVSFFSATTSGVGMTHQLFGIYTSGLALAATSTDHTFQSWPANSMQTYALTATYIVPSTGMYYVAIAVAGSTMPTLKGGTAKTGGQLQAQAPPTGGTSTTGVTTTLPATAAAIGTVTTSIWGGVS